MSEKSYGFFIRKPKIFPMGDSLYSIMLIGIIFISIIIWLISMIVVQLTIFLYELLQKFPKIYQKEADSGVAHRSRELDTLVDNLKQFEWWW